MNCARWSSPVYKWESSHFKDEGIRTRSKQASIASASRLVVVSGGLSTAEKPTKKKLVLYRSCCTSWFLKVNSFTVAYMNSAVTSPSVLGASHLFLFPPQRISSQDLILIVQERLPQLQASSWSTQRERRSDSAGRKNTLGARLLYWQPAGSTPTHLDSPRLIRDQVLWPRAHNPFGWCAKTLSSEPGT